jgi:phosphoglycolate phosphatase-like HAD superfamily hydrolase
VTQVRAVVFDVGETLVSESRAWLAWADWLGIPPLTFLAVCGAVIERGGDHREPFRIFRPDLDLGAELRRREAAGVPDDIRREDLYPDAADALLALRAAGYRVGVAGNSPAATSACSATWASRSTWSRPRSSSGWRSRIPGSSPRSR